MFEGSGLVSVAVFLGVFLGTGGLLALAFLVLDRDGRRVAARLRDLSPEAGTPPAAAGAFPVSALTKAGAILSPPAGEGQTRLRARLARAGVYRAEAVQVLQGSKVVLAVFLTVVFAVVPYLAGVVSPVKALVVAAAAAGIGALAPGFWVDSRAKRRQNALRNAFPDALDMLVLCLEGGVSLTAAVQRLTSELWHVHPLLAAEMTIVQREIQLGLSAGEAVRKFGDRCGLDEVRALAAVLMQSERFGASVAKAVRVHSDTCRFDRQQRAEEMAQKAAVKILFPTLLCIFPAIFIVILGPAAYQIATMFSGPK